MTAKPSQSGMKSPGNPFSTPTLTLPRRRGRETGCHDFIKLRAHFLMKSVKSSLRRTPDFRLFMIFWMMNMKRRFMNIKLRFPGQARNDGGAYFSKVSMQ